MRYEDPRFYDQPNYQFAGNGYDDPYGDYRMPMRRNYDNTALSVSIGGSGLNFDLGLGGLSRLGGNTRFGDALYYANQDMDSRYYRSNPQYFGRNMTSGLDPVYTDRYDRGYADRSYADPRFYGQFNRMPNNWDQMERINQMGQLRAMIAQGFDPRYGFARPGQRPYEVYRGPQYDRTQSFQDYSEYERPQPQSRVQRETEINTHGQRSYPAESMSEYDMQAYNRLARTVNSLIGQKITDYDDRVTQRLGCSRAVSLVMHHAYGFDTDDINVRKMEGNLRKQGFRDAAIKEVKPGDVIIGYREGNDHPHAAVYMGNGKIFNNDSNSGKMQMDSAGKFNSSEFKRIVILRAPDRKPALG